MFTHTTVRMIPEYSSDGSTCSWFMYLEELVWLVDRVTDETIMYPCCLEFVLPSGMIKRKHICLNELLPLLGCNTYAHDGGMTYQMLLTLQRRVMRKVKVSKLVSYRYGMCPQGFWFMGERRTGPIRSFS